MSDLHFEAIECQRLKKNFFFLSPPCSGRSDQELFAMHRAHLGFDHCYYYYSLLQCTMHTSFSISMNIDRDLRSEVM